MASLLAQDGLSQRHRPTLVRSVTVTKAARPPFVASASATPGAALKPQFRLLMVDDHTIVREGLKRVLDPIAHEWEITEAGTGFQALEC